MYQFRPPDATPYMVVYIAKTFQQYLVLVIVLYQVNNKFYKSHWTTGFPRLIGPHSYLSIQVVEVFDVDMKVQHIWSLSLFCPTQTGHCQDVPGFSSGSWYGQNQLLDEFWACPLTIRLRQTCYFIYLYSITFRILLYIAWYMDLASLFPFSIPFPPFSPSISLTLSFSFHSSLSTHSLSLSPF